MSATLARARDQIRVLAFVLVVATIAVLSSEFFYWYPIGDDVVGRALFCLPPVIVTLWAIEHFRVRSCHAVVLAGALYGLLVEGVLAQLVYSGGPFDRGFATNSGTNTEVSRYPITDAARRPGR